MSMENAVQQIGQHSNMMPRERGITLPMVAIEDDAVIVRRLFYFTRAIPEQGTAITPPQYTAVYNLTRGQFVTLKKFDLELPDLPPAPWIHNRPVFESAEDVIPEFRRIWALYDILIAAYVEDRSATTTKVRDAAREYLEYFDRHAEQPLLPYYEYYGGAFLKWVKVVSNY